MKWKKRSLGSLSSRATSGGTPATGEASYYGGEIPWLRTQEVNFNFIEETDIKITDEGLRNSAAKWIEVNSLIVALYGNSAGRVAVNKIPLTTNQACGNFTLDPAKADFRFIYYALLKDYEILHGMAKGAAQNNLNLAMMSGYVLNVPDLLSQARIANILSAYDELIENNRRRMGLLENAARLLYQEWFIHLRFPSHEHTPIINGLPQGWTTYALDDLCLVGRGASPRPIADFMGGEVPWFRIADATASESPYIFHTAEHVTDDGAKKSIILEPGALILSNSATCGIPNFTGVRGCIHDGWLHFANLKRISLQYLYCYFHDKRDELVSSVSDGSTQKNLNTAAVGRLKVVLPPQDALLAQFDQSVGPMFKMIFNLAQQNISLRAARDLLLPRLMSGEIEV